MSHQVHIEIERKYDVDDTVSVPDLTTVPGIARVSEPDTATLEAVYYDTEGLDLANQRIVLRRRAGGADEGWHIKLPADEGRLELHWPLGEETPVPPSVLDLVRVHVRDHELAPVARLTTTRTTYCLFDTAGSDVAEVADDLVSAVDETTGLLRIWREWEVELTDNAPGSPKKRQALLDAVEKRLAEVGAQPSKSISKLAHALGREKLGEAPPRWVLTSKSTAGEVLRAAIAELTDRLKAADPEARQDEPEGVHSMRSAVRRLRSVFATYRPILASLAAAHLETELAALGEVLGAARDPQVMHDRARNLARSQANKKMHEAVLDRVVSGKDAEYHRALNYLNVIMSSTRYFRMLDDLEAFAISATFTPAADKRAAKVLAGGIKNDYARVAKRMAKVNGAANPADWEQRMHAVRKAARRLRFAVEAVSSGDTAIFGDKARRLALAAERVQDSLGEYRDSVLLQQVLLQYSDLAYADGENTFGYGRLHALEQQRADRAIEEYSRAAGEFRAAKRWLPRR